MYTVVASVNSAVVIFSYYYKVFPIGKFRARCQLTHK